MSKVYVEPPHITLIKEKCDGKSDKDNVKQKLRIDPTSSTLELYQLNMSLFGNGELGEFLLFVRNFYMTLVAPGALEAGMKVQYLSTLVHGEA